MNSFGLRQIEEVELKILIRKWDRRNVHIHVHVHPKRIPKICVDVLQMLEGI